MPEQLAKVIVVGDPAVGKTSLSSVLTNGNFPLEYNMTIGVDFFLFRYKDWKLYLWDTAGQESFKSITKTYYRKSAICLLVFDITNSKSFGNIKTWKREVEELNDSVHFVLIGNKCDLDYRREVPINQAGEWARNNNMKYFEVSAKNKNGLGKQLLKTILNDLDENNENIKIVDHVEEIIEHKLIDSKCCTII